MIYSIIIGDLFTDLAAAAAVAHVGPVPVTRRAATAAAPLTALGDARGVSSPPERAREAPQLSTSNLAGFGASARGDHRVAPIRLHPGNPLDAIQFDPSI